MRNLTLLAIIALFAYAEAVAQTDPAEFTSLIEHPRHGDPKAISGTNVEVDDQSIVSIHFDQAKMPGPQPLVPGGPARPRVQIRVEVYSSKGTSRTPIAPVPHFVDLLPAPPAAAAPAAATAETVTQGTVVYHDKYFNPAISAIVPDTEINLRGTSAGDSDFIEVRVTNLATQQSLIVTLIPQKFGFHPKVTDSLMFIKRLGVTSANKTSGVDPVNFSPSPGVTYGGVYYARSNGFVRFFQPGFGLNVLFTKWSDPSFDVATGQFAAGTKSSDIRVGMGPQVSLFGDILQFTYGWNLQADQKRQYIGLGVSFVNISTKIASLIAK